MRPEFVITKKFYVLDSQISYIFARNWFLYGVISKRTYIYVPTGRDYGSLLKFVCSPQPTAVGVLLRQSTSALVGDPDPYPRVFQVQNAIPGSAWVSATR